MPNVTGPVLVRDRDLAQPGLHSHSLNRRGIRRTPEAHRKLVVLRIVLLILGLGGVGYFGYDLVNQHIYQTFENWAFDQQIGGRAPVTFSDYVRERTPFGFLVGQRAVEQAPVRSAGEPTGSPQVAAHPVSGAVLGRVEIGRLNLSAIVREGVDSGTLSRAVGHVPSTSLPGQSGNFAIAAHRDTLFRALKDIHQGDLVEFQSTAGTYKYEVISTRIVKPSDVSVLRPDGGEVSSKPGALLTMITCYPFYYVGSAPKRFIVQAKLMSDTVVPSTTAKAADLPGATGPPPKIRGNKRRAVRQAKTTEPHYERGSSRLHTAGAVSKPKKHGLWHRLFHLS
jgi:sortase A